MLFRSCIKETGLWRPSALGAACPTAVRSLVTRLHAIFWKTWTPRECLTAEVLASVEASKKFDSVSLEISTFPKYIGFDKTALSVIFIKDVWVASYQADVLTRQVSWWSLFPPLPCLCYSCQNAQLTKQLLTNLLVFRKFVNNGDDSAYAY